MWQSSPAEPRRYNQYHLNYESDPPDADNDGYSFGTLHTLNTAISARYGQWSSLDQYVEEAQVQNYETQRAQFEAYIDHSTDATAPSTGVVYWQLNKGWPTLLWDLYNYDYDQAGSYFGAKKANESLHVLYTYDDGTVSVDNLTGRTQSGLSVQSKVYSVAGQLLDDQTASGISVLPRASRRRCCTRWCPPPRAADTGAKLLRRVGAEPATEKWSTATSTGFPPSRTSSTGQRRCGYPQATMTQYADLTQLQNLAGATVRVTARTHAINPRSAGTGSRGTPRPT